MMPSRDLKNHYISILHYWDKGIQPALVIHRKTNISLTTVYYNINKLNKQIHLNTEVEMVSHMSLVE